MKKIEDYQIFFGMSGIKYRVLDVRYVFEIGNDLTCTVYVNGLDDSIQKVVFRRYFHNQCSVEELLESEIISSDFKEKLLFNIDLFRI